MQQMAIVRRRRREDEAEEQEQQQEEEEEEPPTNFIEGRLEMPTSQMVKIRSALMALLECIDGEPVSEGVANKMLQSYAGREGELFASLRKKHHQGTIPQVILTPAVSAEIVVKEEIEIETRHNNRLLLPPIEEDHGAAARRDSYLAIEDALNNAEPDADLGVDVDDNELEIDEGRKGWRLIQLVYKAVDRANFILYEVPLRIVFQIASVTNVVTVSRICIVVHTAKDIMVMVALAPIVFDFPRTFTASFLIAFLPYVLLSIGLGRMVHHEYDIYIRHLLKLTPAHMSRKEDRWKIRLNYWLFPLTYLLFGIAFFMAADLRIASEYLFDDLHRYRLLYWYQYLRIICALTSPAQAFLSAHLLGVRFQPWWRNATVPIIYTEFKDPCPAARKRSYNVEFLELCDQTMAPTPYPTNVERYPHPEDWQEEFVPEIVLQFAPQLLYASILISIFCFCKDLYMIYTRSVAHHISFSQFCLEYTMRLCGRKDDIKKFHYFKAISAGAMRSVVYNGVTLRLSDLQDLDNAMRRLQLGLPIGEDVAAVSFNAYSTEDDNDDKKGKTKNKRAKVKPQGWADPRAVKAGGEGGGGEEGKETGPEAVSWRAHQLRMMKLCIGGNQQSIIRGTAFLSVVCVLMGISVIVVLNAEIQPSEAQHQFCEAPKPSLNRCEGDATCYLSADNKPCHSHACVTEAEAWGRLAAHPDCTLPLDTSPSLTTCPPEYTLCYECKTSKYITKNIPDSAVRDQLILDFVPTLRPSNSPTIPTADPTR
jgi:hypothetical protein